MANLSALIQTRSTVSSEEDNLAAGSIIYFTENLSSGGGYTCYAQWCACSAGNLVVEIWGTSGSASMTCCCGFTMPGNPGAYSKRTIRANQGTCVCFCIGHPCGSPNTQINCGEPTMLCVKNNNAGNFCMCAEGGAGGWGFCIDGSSSMACCFVSGQALCNTLTAGCGWVCNTCSGRHNAQAYGGDINCPGGYSKVYFGHCNPCCTNCWYAMVKTSAGIYGTEPAEIRQMYDYCRQDRTSGQYGFIETLALAGKQPQQGGHVKGCWAGSQYCGCYNMNMCTTQFGVGIPGPAGIPCSNNKNYGSKGGAGAVKITFLSDNAT